MIFNDFDRESPFEPGKPVSPDFFIGRQKTIKKILRYVNKSIHGNTQHFFLTGNRRMGKTSVAKYVKKYVEEEYKMLGVYISNKGNDSVEILTSSIIESIFNILPKDSMKDKIIEWFGKHIESIEIKGNKFKFKEDTILTKSFKEDFQQHLQKIYDEELSGEYNGIFIIIDDINGLSKSREFVDWYKKFADTICVTRNKIPLYFLLAGYPEKFDCLVQQEESFGSIFHYDNIEALTKTEVEEFFVSMFKKEEITISEEALEIMITYSSGLPLMVQQIGESVFWTIEENYISSEDATRGVIEAAGEIGNKQIRPMLNRLRGENYTHILNIIGREKLHTFKKSELKKYLININECVLSNFLYEMLDLEILRFVGSNNSDVYEFNNVLFYTYFLIKSRL